ncbi:MAG: Fic family protein [Arenimonas sp.]|nr:Fic family protein [Arenimonas sp.]MBP7917389.1 Fic family protein [Arenimonas sp.]
MFELCNIVHRVETDRFGPFQFQIGLDAGQLELAFIRVEDAHRRFVSSPLSAVANQLEREVLVQSVHGTNTIEGAELSESQTEAVLDLPPEQIAKENEIRVRNIKSAYDLAIASATNPGWVLDVSFMQAVHAEISRDLEHADNKPGLIRDNPRSRTTYVGNAEHGGRYKPPQYRGDIIKLLQGLVDWHTSLVRADVPALIRAPLVHYYFECIHPFWDGNGRTGRVIEATLLRQAGYRYAPFALSRYYLEHIDLYFTLFNTGRKSAEKNRANPNQEFVKFHLDGMLPVIEHLHGRVNDMVKAVLFQSDLADRMRSGEINKRQWAIVHHVLDGRHPVKLSEMQKQPWFLAMYGKKTLRTRDRDMQKLRTLNLLRTDDGGNLWPGFK